MISKLVNLIPDLAVMIFLFIMTINFVIDLIVTVNTIIRLNKKLEYLEELSTMIKKTSNEIGDNFLV